MTTFATRMYNLGVLLQIADGFSLRRAGLKAQTVQKLRQACTLVDASPRTIIDIGEHRGEFLSLAALAFPTAQIHCFEPVRSSFRELERQAREIGRRVQCHALALGRASEDVKIRVATFTAASSVFDMAPLHREAFPRAASLARVERVHSERLDDWAADRYLEQPILVKLDVQGAELDVLAGAETLLHERVMLLVEMSFDELYVGAPLAPEVMSFLSERGYRLVEILDDLRDPTTNRLLQADGIFVSSPDFRHESEDREAR
ncbi:MAG: FkbM family methyltransferase [Actinomycetota bacterium]|nr:FkbM family methyltransferase [Actinomycetota bacterium]